MKNCKKCNIPISSNKDLCKDCLKELYKKYNSNRSKQRRDYNIKTKYGITSEQYDSLFNKQDGKCAICKKEETSKYSGTLRKLAVDHCHNTGKVRGLLCRKCNIMLGNANDEVDILNSAITYLDNHKDI